MAGRQAGKKADETGKFSKLAVGCEFLLRLTKIQHHYSLTNAFKQPFWIKPIARLIFKA